MPDAVAVHGLALYVSFPAPIVQTPVVFFPPLQSYSHGFGQWTGNEVCVYLAIVLTGCMRTNKTKTFTTFARSTTSTL